MVIPENIHISNIIQAQQTIFRNTEHVYMNIVACNSHQCTKSHVFERRQGMIYGTREEKGRKK